MPKDRLGGVDRMLYLNRHTHITKRKKCHNCGKDLSEIIELAKNEEAIDGQPQYCPFCGYSLGPYRETKLVCKVCQCTLPKELLSEMKFCYNCGTPFEKPKENNGTNEETHKESKKIQSRKANKKKGGTK